MPIRHIERGIMLLLPDGLAGDNSPSTRFSFSESRSTYSPSEKPTTSLTSLQLQVGDTAREMPGWVKRWLKKTPLCSPRLLALSDSTQSIRD